MTGAIGRAMHN